MAAKFIREVYYPDWLANVVMVKKANGKWRMCVDFTDLNKACPNDSYLLPRIDQLVDSTAGHKLLSFMDAFSRYNQIRINEADQEKTSFVTSQGLNLLWSNALWLEKCGSDIPTTGPPHVPSSDRATCRSLCGWHIGEKPGRGETSGRLVRDL